jgi:hypothetical protein
LFHYRKLDGYGSRIGNRKPGLYMTRDDFYFRIVEKRIQKIRDSLISKQGEYSRSEDAFHNFNTAGRILDVTPERALMGMAVKHFVSVLDMIESSGDKVHPAEYVSEKIGDLINYLILVEGMLTPLEKEI